MMLHIIACCSCFDNNVVDGGMLASFFWNCQSCGNISVSSVPCDEYLVPIDTGVYDYAGSLSYGIDVADFPVMLTGAGDE